MNTYTRHNSTTYDNPDFRREALATALAAMGSSRIEVTPESRPFMGSGLLQIAQHSLELAGKAAAPVSDRNALIVQALHSTSDFPLILEDAGGKLLLDGYAAAAPTYKTFTGDRIFRDFKAHRFPRLGDFPELIQVGESAEIKRGTMSEGSETITLAEYGRIIGISRQTLINDDLGAFSSLAIAAGRRAAMFENDLVFTVLLENNVGPVLADGIELFNVANHANFQTTGTAVNVISNLSAGRAAIRVQTGLDGAKLNLRPRILLVGPNNETAAEQITSKTAGAMGQMTVANPFSGSLTPVTDANITDNAWFLFADPHDAPTLVVGSLPGQDGPVISTRSGWDTSGIEFKVMRDFAVGAVDYRGAYRDDGAPAVDDPTAS